VLLLDDGRLSLDGAAVPSICNNSLIQTAHTASKAVATLHTLMILVI